jgi:uncharacterized protein (TIGR02231 family)
MKAHLLLFLFAASTAWAATVDTASTISAVTVYPDRARITRSAEAAVPEGETIIRFSGLPVALDDSSVQAGGTGTGVKILGLEIRTKFSEQVVNDQVRALQDQLQALQDEEKVIRAQINTGQEQSTFLQKVRDGLALSGDSEGKIAPQGIDKIKPLYEFYSTELTRLSKEALGYDIALRDLQPKRKALQEELNRLQGSGSKSQKEVLVAVKASSAATAKLTLNYNMMNASWQPLYDARVNTKDGGIDLAYYGVVRQQTGEDWTNVRLALSTARPSVGARMPNLNPWWLQLFTPRPAARVGYSSADIAVPPPAPAPAAMLSNSLLDRDQVTGTAKVSVPAPMEFETADIDSGGVSTVFEIKIPATIPSDGEPHKVAIATQKFDGKLEYITTPKLDEVAYLKTRLNNSSGAPILGGQVNLFRDGDFVGQSHVNFIAPGADFDFFLGVDDGVKITYKNLVDKSAEGGVFTKRKGVTRKYETTIESFKTQPVKVTVLDQLPVSQDNAITISDVKFNEQPATEKETGKLTWTLTLEPKQKKVLTEEYTITWPADREVEGL